MSRTKVNRLIPYLRRVAGVPPDCDLTDKQLLERFSGQGDQGAFSALVRRHGTMVRGVCGRVLHNHQDAEDVFQATFLILARKAGARGWHDSAGNWLYKVAYRLAIRMKKEINRRRLKEEKAGTRPKPSSSEDFREFSLVLDEELQRMPEKYRGPLLLCYLEGKTRDQVARQLGWSLRTLERRLEQGRELLRKRLTRRGITLSAALMASVLMQQFTQAALPGLLVAGTVKAAGAFAANKIAGGLVSTQVAALANGFIKGLIMTKVKIATAIVVGAAVLGSGSGLVVEAVILANDQGSVPVKRQEPKPGSPVQAPSIDDLIAQLGSNKFSERQEAAEKLHAIGAPALEALRKATKHEDPEVRKRAAEVISSIEQKIESDRKRMEAEKDRTLAAKLLEGRKVRLVFKDRPVTEAVAEFAKKTGFEVNLEGDKSKLTDRKITLDTGEVTVWEALEQFCRKAGLAEQAPINTVRFQTGTKIPDDLQAWWAENKRILMNGIRERMTMNGPDPLVLVVGGKEQERRNYEAGAVRVRAYPASDPLPPFYQTIKQEGDAFLIVDLKTDPHLPWGGILDLRIDQAVDDRGQKLAKKPVGFERLPFWDPDMRALTGNLRSYPVLFKLGKEPAKCLKELKGTITVRGRSTNMPLSTVENIFNTAGKTISCSNGFDTTSVKIVEAARQNNGGVKLHLVMESARSANGFANTHAPLFNLFAKSSSENGKCLEATKPGAEGYQLVVQDSKGGAFHLETIESKLLTPTSFECSLTYSAPKEAGEATKLVISGPRVLNLEIPFVLKDVPLK